MSTDPSALETLPESSPLPSLSSTQKTIILTVQEFDSLCQRVRVIHRVFSRFYASMMAIRSRTKKRPQAHKRLARKLRRQALQSAE